MIILFIITYFPILFILLIFSFLYLLQKFIEKGFLFKLFILILFFLFSFIVSIFISSLIFSPSDALYTGIFIGFIISFIILIIKGTGFFSSYLRFKNSLSYYFKKEKILIFSNNYIAIKKLIENYLRMGEYEKAKEAMENALKNTKEDLFKEKLNMEMNNLEVFINLQKGENKKICKFCKNEIFEGSAICNFCRKIQYPISPFDFFQKKFKINPRIFIIFPIFFILFLLTLNFIIAFSWIFLWFTLIFLIYKPFQNFKIPSKEEFD
ncbi:MAG: hypothetical protein ABIM62_06410 [candidate division WOR-3 bacterium]